MTIEPYTIDVEIGGEEVSCDVIELDLTVANAGIVQTDEHIAIVLPDAKPGSEHRAHLHIPGNRGLTGSGTSDIEAIYKLAASLRRIADDLTEVAIHLMLLEITKRPG